ncbi:FAD/NAD(P)-binding protein [Brevibacterium spongiae]|uniref:FAD/NAD(P)-binding protein n=1 Tax=Brevibacterium spongiae TaxID=2909672 RepID=A0ABY5SN64_9MICO|nr:FAD/NAD(P)-binding protein [Brevibacterium spongiae]UVI35740.1 FAD/NAD(P)-binding protein [Brevibacterium spongiae]
MRKTPESADLTTGADTSTTPAGDAFASTAPGSGRHRADLTFIGAGPKTLGILLAIAARPNAGAGLRIHLIDPFPAGAGRIWRTAQSPHLWMNSRTEDITIFPDESCRLENPGIMGPTLHEWIHGPGRTRLIEAGLGNEAAALDSQSFASRRVQGHYLSAAFETALDRLEAEVHIHRTRAEAVRRADDDRGYVVATADGTQIATGVLVSAQGHLDMHTAEEDAVLADRAAASAGEAGDGLYYQGPGYTADLDFSSIPAGAEVLTRGFGLAFLDFMVMVTEGRGGEFVEDGRRLHYHPSGAEPVLWVGSSRGVSYSPKLGYSRADVPGAPPVELRYLNRLGAGTQTIDFATVLAPLFELELTHAHYAHLLWKRGIDAPELLERIDAAADRVLAVSAEHALAGSAEHVLAGSAERVGADSAGEVPRAAIGTNQHRANVEAIAAAARTVIDDPDDLFDLAGLDRPLDHLRCDDAKTAEAGVRKHIEDRLARSADVHHSADLAVFEALVKSYVAVRMLVRDGRVSHSDRTEFIEGRFHSLFSFIGSGPPPVRVKQILALHEAGLVRFLGPGLSIEADNSGFTARSTAHPEAKTFTHLVDARLARQSAEKAADPVLASLRADGRLLLETTAHAKLRTDGAGRALDAHGRVQKDLFLLGPAVSGSTAEAFSRPHTGAPVFADNERIAATILDAVSLGADHRELLAG